MQSVDPTLLALQTAKTATQNAKKKVLPSLSTQAIAKPSLNVQTQQPQAISTPPTAKVGGISSPFGAPNINSAPILWWATPTEIGTRSKELQSLPKVMPQTWSEVNYKTSISELWTDISKWATLQEIKQAYPEFSSLDDKVLWELWYDIANGATVEEIMQSYPELQWWWQKQWWAKWIIAPTWWFNIPQIQPIAPTTEWNYNPLKTLANAPWSLLNVWINIANMWLSPIQTLKTIAKTAIWWATNLWEIIGEKLAGKENYKEAQQKLLQWEWPVSDFFRFMNESGDNAAQVWDYFKWYADKEELQRRIEEDPAWVLSDVLTVAWYAWWAIQKAWQVSKLWKVAQVWQKLASLEKYDPYTYLPKQAKVLAEKPWIIWKIATPLAWVLNPAETYINQWKDIVEWIKKIPSATSDLVQWSKEAYARKVVWLTENTVEAIKSNKYLSEAEGWKLTRDSLTQWAGTLLNKQIQELSETGRWYSQIRDSWIPIDVSSKKPAINKILSDETIMVDWKGMLDFTDSAIESKADQAQLQKVYDYFNRWEVTPDVYLNKKKAIRDMTDFSQGNTDQTNRILKQIGAERKSAWHESIPELKQLDAIYEPQINDINEIRNKIFDNKWNLREWATSYIMNSLWANRDITLQKLEKLIPEISEQVKAIRAVEDISNSKWIKPWTYNKTAAIIWWVKAGSEAGKAVWNILWPVGEFVWWWIGWIVWAIGWIIATDPAYIINKLRWVDVKLPDEILQKIKAKEELSIAQKTKVKEILSSLDKKKQDVIIEQVKKDQKYPIKLKQEWPQTLWATLPKPMAKTPPITVEKGAIGMWTKATVLPPKPTVAPSVWEVKTTSNGVISNENKKILTDYLEKHEKARNNYIKSVYETYDWDTAKSYIKERDNKYWPKATQARDALWIKRTKKSSSDVQAESFFKGLQKEQWKTPPAPKWFKWLWKETMEQNITKADDNLMQEAKKYKSAEEFINNSWERMYRWTNNLSDDSFVKWNIFLSPDESNAKVYWSNIKEYVLPKQAKIIDGSTDEWERLILQYEKSKKRPFSMIRGTTDRWWQLRRTEEKPFFDWLDKKWIDYDWVYFAENSNISSIALKSKDTLKTESQLKQIREQANKKPLPPLPKKWLPKLWKEVMEQNITKADDSLTQEAKKYKSADEFAKAQETTSLKKYAWAWFKKINDDIRKWKMSNDIENIYNYITESPDKEVGTFYRSTNIPKDIIEKIKKEKVFESNQFLSASAIYTWFFDTDRMSGVAPVE